MRSEHWTSGIWEIPFLLVGTSDKTMAFFIYLYFMAMTTLWTVLIQLRLKEGKQPLKPGLLRHREGQWRLVSIMDGSGIAWRANGAYHRPLTLAMSAWNWRERRPLAPPSRKEDLMGGSNSFLRFLFSSVKNANTPQNISKGDTNMSRNLASFYLCCYGSCTK